MKPFLISLIALTAGLSSPALAEVDKKTAEFCMKAADFAELK